MQQSIVRDALLQLDPSLFQKLHDRITAETLYAYLAPIAKAHAPSQSARWTRSPIIASLLQERGLLHRQDVQFYSDYERTGCSALLLGQEATKKEVWFLSHLDSISYAIQPAEEGGRYPLVPLCYHMMEPGRQRAIALQFDLTGRRFEAIARGEIVTASDGAVYFEPNTPVTLRAGQRVVYDAPLQVDWDNGTVRGDLDDSGGVAALLLAAEFLADYPVELLLTLTDEEEGAAGAANQTICRGGARILRYFEQPRLVVDVDVHEAAPMAEGSGPSSFQPGQGASYAEKGSRGRGVITPPPLFELQRKLAGVLAEQTISLRENWDGYVSRSEGINAMLRTPNIALLGFLCSDRHFNSGVPSAHLDDLVNLSRAAVCYTLLTQTEVWKEIMGP